MACHSYQKRVDAAIQRKEIVTVKGLLEDTGKWQIFRHHRASFPLTLKQVEAFKKSEASQRKTGGREAHAKKLLAIQEGRQKPFVYKYRPRRKLKTSVEAVDFPPNLVIGTPAPYDS